MNKRLKATISLALIIALLLSFSSCGFSFYEVNNKDTDPSKKISGFDTTGTAIETADTDEDLPSRPLDDSEIEDDPDPVIEPDPQDNPVTEPDPVVDPEPINKPDPVVDPEPINEPDPVVDPEPVIEPDPQDNPVTEPDPVVDPEPINEPDPIVDPEPVIEPDPQDNPVTEPDPVVDPEPQDDPDTTDNNETDVLTMAYASYMMRINKDLSEDDAIYIAKEFQAAANARNYIDVETIMALAMVESRFRPYITGNYVGLFQTSLKYGQAAGYTEEMLLDPHYNTQYALSIVDDGYIKLGDLTYALLAFNQGYYALKNKIDSGAEINTAFADNVYSKAQIIKDYVAEKVINN